MPRHRGPHLTRSLTSPNPSPPCLAEQQAMVPMLGEGSFQCPIGPFIADFYCAQFRLVVEIDGGIHERQREADQARSQQFGEYGYQVIRFQNREVEDDLEGVLKRIWDFCQDSDKTPLPLSGEG